MNDNISKLQTIPVSESKANTCLKLVWGTTGIYISLLISALLNEKILKYEYTSFEGDGLKAKFSYPIIFLLVPNFLGFLIGKSFNSFQKKQPPIPKSNLLKISVTVMISCFTFNAAILYLEFPIVVLVKSCNILSVIMVGVFCSKVKAESSQKIGKQKLIVGILVSFGIIVFFAGNQLNVSIENQKPKIGFLLLAISIIADGFLPDFQAQVKQKYNPGPMALYEKTTLWVFLLSLVYSIATKQIFEIVNFMHNFPSLILDVFSQSLMACIGQLFVYYIVFNFKQHVAPFILTSRKIASAIVSIIFFNHPVNFYQIIGLCLVVFGIVVQLVLSKIMKILKEFKQFRKHRNYDVI